MLELVINFSAYNAKEENIFLLPLLKDIVGFGYRRFYFQRMYLREEVMGSLPMEAFTHQSTAGLGNIS